MERWLGLFEQPRGVALGSASRAKLAIAVLLLGRRAWSRRSRDEPVTYCFLPLQRKDRTIKPWDQTPSCRRCGGYAGEE